MTDRSWDVAVAARLAVGDATALAEVYDQLGGYVYGLARRVVSDASLAEDVAQEVFSQLWERPGAYDPGRGALRTFLGVLTHRRSVDIIRRQEAARRREESSANELVCQPDIAEEVGAYLVADHVRAALDRLPDDQRRAVLLAYFEGHTFTQIATLLGIPEGTAKSRIRLGLGKLQVALSAGGVVSCR